MCGDVSESSRWTATETATTAWLPDDTLLTKVVEKLGNALDAGCNGLGELAVLPVRLDGSLRRSHGPGRASGGGTGQHQQLLMMIGTAQCSPLLARTVGRRRLAVVTPPASLHSVPAASARSTLLGRMPRRPKPHRKVQRASAWHLKTTRCLLPRAGGCPEHCRRLLATHMAPLACAVPACQPAPPPGTAFSSGSSSTQTKQNQHHQPQHQPRQCAACSLPARALSPCT